MDTLKLSYEFHKDQTFYYHKAKAVTIDYLTDDKDIAVKIIDENVVKFSYFYKNDDYSHVYFEAVGEGTTEVEFSTKGGKPIVAKITVPPIKSLTGLEFREKEATYDLSDTSYKSVYWNFIPNDFNDPNLNKIVVKTSDVSKLALSYPTNSVSEYTTNSTSITIHPKAVGTVTLTLTATMADGTTLTDTMTVNVTGEEETPVATMSARMAKTATQEQEIIIFERGADE